VYRACIILIVHKQYMAENGGVIVNIIADMFRGFPMIAHTGATRAGVENLSRSLAVEWASDGVRVNSVAWGHYVTDFSVFDMARPGLPSKRLGSTAEASSGGLISIHLPGSSFKPGPHLKELLWD
jgi:peroxisomal trans-2-enoyl-CoA reductase